MPPNWGQAVLKHTPNILILIQVHFWMLKTGMENMSINVSVTKNILLKISIFLEKLAPQKKIWWSYIKEQFG